MSNRILIIAYAYPPSTLIAGQRPYTWARELVKAGFEVTVVTRHWKGHEKKHHEIDEANNLPNSETIEEGIRVIRLSFSNQKYLAHQKRSLIGRIGNSLSNIFTYNTTINPYNVTEIQQFLKVHLQSNSYDWSIVTCPPNQYLKIAAWLNKKYNIRFWADFRDYLFLFDTTTNTLAASSLFKKIVLKSFIRQTYNHLSKAEVISSVSLPIIKDLKPNQSHKEVVVLNGFDNEVLPESVIQPRTDKFTISILGTIYEKQDRQFMFDGFKAFLADKHDKVIINFIGTGSDEKLRKIIEQEIGFLGLNVTGWLPRAEAQGMVANSNILYYIGWQNLKGIYSGKVFEYLGAFRNILVGPNDHDVVEQLITSTQTGRLADTPQQMTSELNDWYLEWEKKGYLNYNSSEKQVAFYSRKEQAKEVIKTLKSL